MEAAVLALRQKGPAAIVAAAPVGAPASCDRLSRIADRVICVVVPDGFDAVGAWYRDFDQTSDGEVTALLAASANPL